MRTKSKTENKKTERALLARMDEEEMLAIMGCTLPPEDEAGLRAFATDLSEAVDSRTREIIRNAAYALKQCETDAERQAVIQTAAFFAARMAKGTARAVIYTIEEAANGTNPLADIEGGAAAYIL